MTEVKDIVRATLARAVFAHAVNPSVSAHLSRSFGGDGKPVTREDVEKNFGQDAAQAWQDARDAKARYFAAIREGGSNACVSCGAPTPNDFCGFCLEEE